MYRACYLIFLTILLASCDHQKPSYSSATSVPPHGKRIPDTWIEKLRHRSYTVKDSSLLPEFEKAIAPDTIYHPQTAHINSDCCKVINTMFVDLDGDTGEEMVSLLGWDEYSPYLCLFKQYDGVWYLIYKELVETFYSAPTLTVANNYSKNKPFYLRHVDNHGSGVYQDSYSIYKLIDGKVYKCLDLINDAHIYGWGLLMNQEVTSTFEFSQQQSDYVSVTYKYRFFPGAIYREDYQWCSNSDLTLLQDEYSIDYQWNTKTNKYELKAPSKAQSTGLTAEKIACFGDFGNDSLFVKAFAPEIENVLKDGTPKQKKTIKDYLKKVRSYGTARTEELEIKATTGNTTFYGPKK